ncbi:hypothetical protein DEV91_10611 [Phyllobacterium brassicacearum]|nr:hypothetical protein DEV91_10611 [Phyllobacterium brassicacearum]
MVTRVRTVAFQGIEAQPFDVQVRSPFSMALPHPWSGFGCRYFNRSIAATMISPLQLDSWPGSAQCPDALQSYVVLGELSLDGTITHVAGDLPAVIPPTDKRKG